MASYLVGNANDNKRLLPRHGICCDMGEGFGPWKLGPDAQLMPLIDMANIACAGHAGTPTTMYENVQLAKQYGVRVGAHPGLPDKEGFGRRRWALSPAEVYNLILYQVGALKAFLDAEGMPLEWIKPHGELYFYIERDEEIMKAVIRAAKAFGVPLVAAKSDHYQKTANAMGVKLIQEVYPDLAYASDGSLRKPFAGGKAARTPETIGKCIEQAMLSDTIIDLQGNTLSLNFKGAPIAFCLHSDFPTSLDNARAARTILDRGNKAAGFSVKTHSGPTPAKL